MSQTPKTRTLKSGIHDGKPLKLNHQGQYLTVWDGMLVLKRDRLDDPLIRHWRGRLLVGGRFWREVPHPMCADPRQAVCYPDTLMMMLSWPIRFFLLPGWSRRLRFWRID